MRTNTTEVWKSIRPPESAGSIPNSLKTLDTAKTVGIPDGGETSSACGGIWGYRHGRLASGVPMSLSLDTYPIWQNRLMSLLRGSMSAISHAISPCCLLAVPTLSRGDLYQRRCKG